MNQKESDKKESVRVFSKELKRLLEKAEIKQIDFANNLGVSKNSVNKWVSGQIQPKLHQLKLIINFFISNEKTKDFNPLQLFFSASVLYDPTSTEYEKAIHQIKEVYDLQLKQQTDILQNKINVLEKKCADRSKMGEEYSKRKYYLESLLLDKRQLKQKESELKEKERTYRKKVREEIVQNVLYRGIYPGSTAKQILRDPELQSIIKKMLEYEKENGLTETYREYYQNLLNVIIETMDKQMTDIIKRIYNPDS